MNMKLRYKYFLARLKYELNKLGHGGKTYIGKNIGKSGSFIGQIIDPNANKKASVDTQIAIAEFISGSEEKFIQEGLEYEEYGFIKEDLLSLIKNTGQTTPQSPPSSCVTSLQDEADKKHQIVIPGFENKELAIKCNEVLVEIESLDPDELQEMYENLVARRDKLIKKKGGSQAQDGAKQA